MSITTDLDAIRARADSASPGPWTASAHPEFGFRVASGNEGWVAWTGEFDDEPETSGPDSEFIAHARTDVPFLLDLVDELRRQVKVWKGKAE